MCPDVTGALCRVLLTNWVIINWWLIFVWKQTSLFAIIIHHTQCWNTSIPNSVKLKDSAFIRVRVANPDWVTSTWQKSVFQVGKRAGCKINWAQSSARTTEIRAQFSAQTTQNLLRVNDQNMVLWAIDENMGTNPQAVYKHYFFIFFSIRAGRA